MSESQPERSPELKAGDSATYQVKGKTITLEPLPIGKLKGVFGVLSNPVKDDLAVTIADYLLLVLDVEAHPFLTREWIEKNVTLPIYNQIVQDATKINGLTSFLNGEKRTEKELRETVN